MHERLLINPRGYHEEITEEMHSIDVEKMRIGEFSDVYDSKIINKDKKKVLEREKKFSKDPKRIEMAKISDMFEILMSYYGELEEWFGNDAYTLLCSDYDDIFNGFDLAVEVGGKNHYLFGLDLTYSSNLEILEKKFGRIKDDILKGDLGTIKYYHSEYNNYRGRKKNVPRLIMGFFQESVTRIVEDHRANKKDFADQSPYFQCLDQAVIQLNVFLEFARLNSKRNSSNYNKIQYIINKFSRLQKYFMNLYKTKKVAVNASNEIKSELFDDGYTENLIDALNNTFELPGFAQWPQNSKGRRRIVRVA